VKQANVVDEVCGEVLVISDHGIVSAEQFVVRAGKRGHAGVHDSWWPMPAQILLVQEF